MYVTAGMTPTQEICEYSALPMRFGKSFITALDVVYEKETTDIFIGTKILREYQAIVKLKEIHLPLLDYRLFSSSRNRKKVLG